MMHTFTFIVNLKKNFNVYIYSDLLMEKIIIIIICNSRQKTKFITRDQNVHAKWNIQIFLLIHSPSFQSTG